MPLAIAFGAGLVLSIVGVTASSMRAARITPAEALRDSKIDTKVMTTLRWVSGSIMFACGTVMVILAAFIGGETATPLTAMRQDMISQIGASASRDEQADWVSHRAMQIAGGNHELADDLEAMFHLLVTDRPDANIITGMIRRAVSEHPLAGRLPTRKDINGVLNFFRQDIAIHKLVDNATEKPVDDWLRARRQWIHVLRTTRRFSESLGLNREDFRTMDTRR